mmetsp:Transcript_52654/g.125800  ORF Transcript_52654/g.125800 Transcript_52654/m.125800 type:complete len:287 (-) Transcript_52654:139-999(-)
MTQVVNPVHTAVYTQESSKDMPDVQARRVRTLYLLRHGEAEHNVEEKKAAATASAAATQAGYVLGSPEYVRLVEAARHMALQQEALLDAALTQLGKEEAKAAKTELESLLSAEGLAAPSSIFVSPLQRALQTATIVFPEHPSIHVREQLRERRTGLPCDEHVPQIQAARRSSFQHMSFDCLMRLASGEGSLLKKEQSQMEIENIAQLRLRTQEIAKVLRSVDDDSLCVVSHKGFLRELERGPLGRTEAAEFANCEVRVYNVEIFDDDSIQAKLRCCRKPRPSSSAR